MAVKATTLVTIEQVRDWVLNDLADSSKDLVLTLIADAASERLERDTARIFRSRAVTDRHIGDGAGSVLYLKRYPIISITSFTTDGVAVDATRYYVDAERGRIVLKNGAVFGDNADLAITYTAGYAAADLPSDAVEVCLHLCKRAYQLKTKGGQSFQSVSMGGHSFMMRDTLPSDIVKAIEKLSDKRFG